MKGSLCLYLSKLRSLLMRFCSSGLFSLHSIVSSRCAMARHLLSRVGYGLLAVSVVVCSLFSSSSSSAISPVSTGNLTPANLVVYYSNANSQSCRNISGSAIRCTFGKQGGLSATEITGIDIELPRFLPEYTYTTFQVSLTFNEYPAKVEYTGFTTDFDSTLVNQEVTWNAYQNLSFQIDTFATAGVTRIALRPQNGKGSALYYEWGPSTSYTITVSAIHYFEDVPGPEFVDFMNVVKSAIKDGNFNVNVDNSDVTSAIGSASDQAHKDSQAQLGALEEQNKLQQEQNKQEQDRYDKDKQEEADRENSANDDGNKLLGIFNIAFVNPFDGLFQLFNPGTCANIPTIANWLGTDQTTYCSWWPSSVRSVLTPVFGLSSAMILVGFVISWLRDASVGLDKSTNIVEGFHGF